MEIQMYKSFDRCSARLMARIQGQDPLKGYSFLSQISYPVRLQIQ